MAKAAGIGTEVKIGDSTYTLMPVKLRHLAESCQWAQSKLTNPLAAVMAALNSEHGKSRDRWAAKASSEFVTAKAKADEEQRAWTEEQNRANAAAESPNDALRPTLTLDPELERENLLAATWQSERRELLLRAYNDAHGPKPQFDDPIFYALRDSLEGRCHHLWLSLKQKHGEQFKTHLDVLDLMEENMTDLFDAYRKLTELNEPEKNSKSLQVKSDRGAGELTGASSLPTARAA